MYIQQIIIEGFKSYGQRTVVESFDPGHNVIVGKNGSGKSNFFFAIQFVLSDEFIRLRADQREHLLYEGSGPKVIYASVEIIFNNSDRRIPIEKDEVHLKRVIGLKKDQYFLNKKLIQKSDVVHILESAGFSRSNPYYIVKQGKINEMSMSPDSRLKLLREIAGTEVYEEKKQESISILKSTHVRWRKIQDLLVTIDKRLETLKLEMQELKDYETWDKKRRCIEHVIHEQMLMESKKKLKDLEADHTKYSKMQSILVVEDECVKRNIKKANKEYKKAQKEVETAKEEEDLLESEEEQLLIEKTKLTFRIQDLTEEVKRNNENRIQIEKELEILNTCIDKNEAKLQNIKPQYEYILHTEEEITRELNLKKQKLRELYNKEGRAAKFKNKAKRDMWIKQELMQLDNQIDNKKKNTMNIEEDLKRDEKTRATLEKRIQDCVEEMNRQKVKILEYNDECFNLNKQKDEYLAQLKDLYRKDKLLQDQMSALKEDLAKTDRELRSMFGKSTVNGKNSLYKVLDTFRKRDDMANEVHKYCGLVIENFNCNPQFYKAVEVIAGNRLFYHIIKTSKFGNQILREMNAQQLLGEVTFMPLDRLNVQDISYPKSSDAFPLIDKLEHDDNYDKPLRHIFGRTLVCRDIKIATKMARDYHLDCVTLQGDQAGSKGWIKGGYFNNLRSSMKTQKDRSEILNQIHLMESDSDSLIREIREVNNNITLCISNLQRSETKMSKARDIYNKIRDEISIMKEEINSIDMHRLAKEKSLHEHKASLEAIYATKESLENEMQQDLMEHLSAADQQQIDNFNDSITRLTKELNKIIDKRVELEIEKNKLENLLANNLIRKKDELSQSIQEILVENQQQLLEAAKTSFLDVENKISKNIVEFETQKKKVADAVEEQKAKALEVERLKMDEKEIQEKMETLAKKLEKLNIRENIINQDINNNLQKLSELGTIPSNELCSKFSKRSTKELFKILEETNSHLKKYRHVNKKALDQFNVFRDQKKIFSKRKEELDRAYKKIEELMNVLQEKKYEAIEFTFKQVSKYFTDIFRRLVPNGMARLIMKTASDRDYTDTVSETSENFDSFVGIDIEVSFTGQTSETREIHQLSGGQKSLIALTLIFAIQKCDPAPFYLFDEIDQALDAVHRKAVAKMIHGLSSEAQFITTTFRPELLQYANKFYAVRFYKNLSFIDCVSREKAAEFVENQTT